VPSGAIRGKKARFLACCQENILDTKASDNRYDQCLQGFRSSKISVTMSCGTFAVYANMRKHGKNYE
jgi:hypothetical protein